MSEKMSSEILPATLIFPKTIRNTASSGGDVTKLLNFNVDRKLEFDSGRYLQFNPNRKLHFNLNRDLSFDLNRDLGFGKRGVIFRGYVCSSCGGLVNPMARECDECGAIFSRKQLEKNAKKFEGKTKSRQRFCQYCGNPISGPDTYCGNCGSRLRGNSRRRVHDRSRDVTKRARYETVKLPRKGRKKTITDWKETGKEFEDFQDK